VATPESADDVVAVIEIAREHGLRVAPQGTGHGAPPRASLEGSVLADMSRMNAVEIDPEHRRARLQAGAQWQHVVGPAAEHGLAGLSGTAPDVCVTGYATGGGSFGIVTALELELFLVRELYAGVLFWPQERAAEVLKAWHEWTADLPEEMTSLGRLLNVPPLEEIPEPVRGRSFVMVEAAWLGDEAGGSEQLAPLRELGPEIDTFAMIPPPGLAALHMDPPQPVPGVGDGMLLGDVPDAAIDGVVAAAGPGTDSPLLSIEFRHLGGAADRPDAEHGALAAIDAPYLMYAVGMAMSPEIEQAVSHGVDQVHAGLAPWDSGRFLNFTERPGHAGRMFTDDVYRRLCEVKSKYDPGNVIQANHEIPPASS
jgi:FAD binding domain/Berberine and berberine like